MARQSPALPREPSPSDAHPKAEAPSERLADLEAAVANIQHSLDVQFKRIASVQAELDQIAARNRTGEER